MANSILVLTTTTAASETARGTLYVLHRMKSVPFDVAAYVREDDRMILLIDKESVLRYNI
jgi:hypothetical protein